MRRLETPVADTMEATQFAGVVTLEQPIEGSTPHITDLRLAESAATYGIQPEETGEDGTIVDRQLELTTSAHANLSFSANTERPRSIRQWLASTRLGRMTTATVTATTLFAGSVGVSVLEATPAHASTANQEYAVNPSAAAGGVYARSGPNSNDTQHIPGYGIYPGDTVQLICGVTNGTPVGSYNNTTWHYVEDLSNPGEGDFWVNDHYLDTPNAADHLAPGEATCPNESSDPTKTPDTSGNTDQAYDESGYSRNAAAAWALKNAKDNQPFPTDDEDCTWFVSQALWAGGLAQTTQWTSQGSHGHSEIIGGSGVRPGSVTAWSAPNLVKYILQEYPDSTFTPMSFSQNSQPLAQPGDIIAYDWDGQGIADISHLSVVVDDAPNTEYPEVSEWGNLHPGQDASTSIKQGWTWSRYYNKWIQKAYHDPHAYLLHVVVDNY